VAFRARISTELSFVERRKFSLKNGSAGVVTV
jgi:hypothetical protein